MRLKFSRPVTIGTLALLAGATPLTGQWRAEPILSAMEARAVPADLPSGRVAFSLQSQPASDLTLAVAGVAGAAFGSLGGAFLGYHFDRAEAEWGCERGCEDPGVWGLLGGWFVGSALATPLAVHLANGSRGSLGSAYVSSAVLASAGMAGVVAIGSPGGAFILLGVPVAQAISAVLIERRVAK